jgi:orotate phosphoribosyltransferase
MSSARQDLLRLLAAKSFRLGQFKLSSGGTSDYYVDCRTTTLAAKGARLTGQVFLDEIRARQWKPRAVGGLTMGADPIVVAVSIASGDIEGFLVRKAEKQHGTGRRIEGFQEKGARVVIVDDVCTTGSSTIQAIEAVREFGFQVVGTMCLVEREEAGGRPSVEQAAAPAPFVSIFKAADVRQEHLLQNDETSPGMPAVGVGCEICGRPAVVHNPRIRCEAHKT